MLDPTFTIMQFSFFSVLAWLMPVFKHHTQFHTVIRYDTARCDVARHNATRHDIIRYDTIQHDMTQYDTVLFVKFHLFDCAVYM